MTTETPSHSQVAELQSAFRIFTDATATLERQYRSLEQRARVLGAELWESALLKVRPSCGEELVLEAN